MEKSTMITVPPKHRALVLNSTRDPYDITLIQRTTPQAGSGSVVIQILTTGVLTYAKQVYTGKKPYPYPTPFVPGSSAIARVVEIGPDTTTLKAGQLVFFDCFIEARDDPDSLILSGLSSGFTPASTALMEGEWRDGTYAEYVKAPLENCFALDESRLCGDPANGGFGYSVADLTYLLAVSVPFGGFKDVQVNAGEKVIVAPAAGMFGGAAVIAALALGAQVIAVGRNLQTLESLKQIDTQGRIRIVQMTGDVSADTKKITEGGKADVFYDISPGKALKSTHFASCIQSLSRGGRVSLMGAHPELTLPMRWMVLNDIAVRCKWMYSKTDIRNMIKLLELGNIKLGQAGGIQTVGTYGLEHFDDAFEAASQISGPLKQVVITP